MMTKDAISDGNAPVRYFWKTLVGWFSACGRDLPWRHAPTAYETWVSEIMLQQTQVATVLPYYERWMAAFPDIPTLARSTPDDVLSLWAGLGYYRRARYLRDGARYIAEQCGGVFPTEISELRKIPGVGEYTAGAIASFAFGQNVPAIDGNAERVFSRFFDIEGDIARGAARKRLSDIARRAAAFGRAADLNQAVMDLGSSICGRAAQCELCPIAPRCAARRLNKTAILPQKPKPPEKSGEFHVAAALVTADRRRVLIARRAPGTLLGGLWQFPSALAARCGASNIRALAQEPAEARRAALLRAWTNRIGCAKPEVFGVRPPSVEHIFSHIRMIVSLDIGILPEEAERVIPAAPGQIIPMTPTDDAPCDAYAWAEIARAEKDFAVSSLMKKLIANLKRAISGEPQRGKNDRQKQ